jgi:hypothetical protein
MDAASTSLEQHERGIHALRSGAGGARVTKVRSRAAERFRSRAGQPRAEQEAEYARLLEGGFHDREGISVWGD